MSSDTTILVYVLIKQYTEGGHTFGPSILKFIFKASIESIRSDDDKGGFCDFEKIKDELIKRQPQVPRDEIIGYEQVDYIIC